MLCAKRGFEHRLSQAQHDQLNTYPNPKDYNVGSLTLKYESLTLLCVADRRDNPRFAQIHALRGTYTLPSQWAKYLVFINVKTISRLIKLHIVQCSLINQW